MARISRNTKQKEIIRRELKKFGSFFTAEELYSKVKNKNSSLGLATVYRFLNDLAKKESLHSYSCNKKTVYSANKQNHFHFICEKCEKISHISVKNIDFIKKAIKDTICHLQVDAYGICTNCLKNK